MISNEPHAGEKLVENLREKKCLHCGSEHITPFIAIEQEIRSPHEYWHTIIALCGTCKKGQFERSYSDMNDYEDIFEQTELFLLDETSMARLREYIEQKEGNRIIGTSRTGCPASLSPQCTCGVHFVLTQASKRIEPLSDADLQERNGRVSIVFLFTKEGFPIFIRSY